MNTKILPILTLILVVVSAGCVQELKQLDNSGDMRCALQDLKICHWYNIQANSGIVVDECKNVSVEDFCWKYSHNITRWQIVIEPESLNLTFHCNYNYNRNWCDYTEYECTPWRLGYSDEIICKVEQNMSECSKENNVTLCWESQ